MSSSTSSRPRGVSSTSMLRRSPGSEPARPAPPLKRREPIGHCARRPHQLAVERRGRRSIRLTLTSKAREHVPVRTVQAMLAEQLVAARVDDRGARSRRPARYRAPATPFPTARSRDRRGPHPPLDYLDVPDLLETIREQIAARLEKLRPLAREASDLQRALDALNGAPAPTAAGGRRRRRASGPVRSAAAVRLAAGRPSGPCRGIRSCKPGLYRERRGRGARAQSRFGDHAPDSAQQARRTSEGAARLLSRIAELRCKRDQPDRRSGRTGWRPKLARIEKELDIQLSTLERYVEALGDRLEIYAIFTMVTSS